MNVQELQAHLKHSLRKGLIKKEDQVLFGIPGESGLIGMVIGVTVPRQRLKKGIDPTKNGVALIFEAKDKA
jgi:hypothetical protein